MLVLPLVIACVVPDSWTPAREACGLDAPLVLDDLEPTADGRHGLVLPTGCPEVLLADLGGDADVVTADLTLTGTLDEHVEAVRTGDAPLDGLVVALWGMYWLAGVDLGTVGALAPGAYTDPVWVEDFTARAEEQGGGADSPLAEVLYNDVAERITELGWLPNSTPVDAAMGVPGGTGQLLLPRPTQIVTDAVWPTDSYGPNVTAWGLVHESVHSRVDSHPHVECGPPASSSGRVCDADLTGAYGAEFAAAWAEITVAADGGACLADSMARDVAAVDLQTLQLWWQQQVMLPLPDQTIPACESP